jgi:hypothetical protein
MPILYMLKVSVYAGFMQIFSGTYCGLSFFFSSEEPERTENITYQIPAGLLFR